MKRNTYMMQRIKRRCVERYEQKCMAQKIREKRRSQRLFGSFSRFLSLFIPPCVDLFAFLELRPHVDVVECQAIQIQANFICHLFRLIFFLLLFSVLPLEIRLSFESQGIRHVRCILSQTETGLFGVVAVWFFALRT